MTDLERAFEALKTKGGLYDRLWAYYDGVQPLKYSTQRLRDVFQQIDVRFVENWCAVVVNAVLDRMVLRRFVVNGDETATTRLNRLWAETGMKLDDDDAHLAALVCGEAFVIVWNDPVVGLEAYYNDPRMCHLFYDEEHPRRKALGAKWWRARDGIVHLNLYYPDRIEYYATERATDQVDTANQLVLRGAAEHQVGELPLFHLRREGRATTSEMGYGVLTLQDAVNKLVSDMMVSAEFSSFKQRYIISQAEIAGQLKNAPNEIWEIPASDGIGQQTQVGELSATELTNYLDPIDHLATAMAIITRTPKHFFFEKAGSNPSGESLIALEAPLNAKASRYIERFESAWQETAAFLMRLDGWEGDPMAIQPIFGDPRTLQPLTQAQARLTDVNAGIPLRTVVRREGWSTEDIEQMEADRREEATQAQTSLARALLEQQRRFDRGDEGR